MIKKRGRSVTAGALALSMLLLQPLFALSGEFHLINDLAGNEKESESDRNWNEDILSAAVSGWQEAHKDGKMATASSLDRKATASSLPQALSLDAQDSEEAERAVKVLLRDADEETAVESAAFLSRTLKAAAIPEDGIPRMDALKDELAGIISLSTEDDTVFFAGGDYTPEAGDLVFFALTKEAAKAASASGLPAPETRTPALAGIILENAPSDDLFTFLYGLGKGQVEMGAARTDDARIIGFASVAALHDRYCGDAEEAAAVPETVPAPAPVMAKLAKPLVQNKLRAEEYYSAEFDYGHAMYWKDGDSYSIVNYEGMVEQGYSTESNAAQSAVAGLFYYDFAYDPVYDSIPKLKEVPEYPEGFIEIEGKPMRMEGWVETGSLTGTVYTNGSNPGLLMDQDRSFTAKWTEREIVHPTSVTVTPSEWEIATFEMGQTQQLTATVLPENADNRNYSWISSNSEVATVDENGLVTMLSKGTAVISAVTEDGGITGTCTVRVKTPAASITMYPTEIRLIKGQELRIHADVRPQDADDRTVIWSSSGSGAISILRSNIEAGVSYAVIRGENIGSATLTATSQDDLSMSVSTTVEVIEQPTDAVTLDQTSMTLRKDGAEGQDTGILTATVWPESLQEASIHWISSNGSVVSFQTASEMVDGTAECYTSATSGRSTSVMLVAKGGGTATIKAIADSGVFAECQVTVTQAPTGVSIEEGDIEIVMVEGMVLSTHLTAKITPDNADDQNVRWSSSNNFVAMVDDLGNVTARRVGTAVITASTEDPVYSASVTVTVKQQVSAVVLSRETTTLLLDSNDDSYSRTRLYENVLPYTATDKTVTWRSSNTSIVTVDQNGRIAAVAPGTANITATSNSNEAAFGTCKVTVKRKATSIEVLETEKTMTVGSSEKIRYNILPEGSELFHEFSSSNPDVATVAEDGTVTAVARGTATITLQVTDDESKVKKNAYLVNVTVKSQVESIRLSRATTVLLLNAAGGEHLTERLTATVIPADADQSVDWSSSDDGIVSVETDGRITAKAAGTATVTATSVTQSGISDSCVVTVKEKASDIIVSTTEKTLMVGDSDKILYNIVPEGAELFHKFSSSDETVATVGTDGTITGQKAGEAVITLQVTDTESIVPQSSFKVKVTVIERTEGQPQFKRQSVLLSGQIGVNFFLDLPDLDGQEGLSEYEDSYMEFTVNGKTATAAFDPDFKNTSGEYYGFTCHVNSIQMGEIITAVFHYGDGQSIQKKYSVKEYIISLDTSTDVAVSDEQKALVHALADYGHYIQPYLAGVRGWTIGKDYARMDKYYTTGYDYGAIGTEVESEAFAKALGESNIENITYSLYFDTDTAIYIYIKPAADYTGSISFKLDNETVSPQKRSDGRYRVEVPGISAHLLGGRHTVEVTTDGGTATASASGLSYVSFLLQSSSAGAKDAAAALYNYYDAAEKYNN